MRLAAHGRKPRAKSSGHVALRRQTLTCRPPCRQNIRLLSTDFDGTLVAHHADPVLDARCMELIRELQEGGAIWAINTGRSRQLLESGLMDFDFPVHPDFILTSERDVFRRAENGRHWEPFGDWNSRVARIIAELYSSAAPVYADVLDFVQRNTRARDHSRGARSGRVDRAERRRDGADHCIHRRSARRASEVPLPAQHRLSAVLPCRLPQGRGASGAAAADRDPARADVRRGRSCERYLDARWRLRAISRLPGERDRRR